MGNSKGNIEGNNRVYNQTEMLARVKKVLQENGIDTSTQKSIGDYFGVVSSAISNWENNKKPIGLEKLIKVSSDFNVSLDWLVFGIEQNREEPAEIEKEPDPLETVQEKNKTGYNILEICQAIVTLSNSSFAHITIDENNGFFDDMGNYTFPSFSLHVSIDNMNSIDYLHFRYVTLKTKNPFSEKKFSVFWSKCMLTDFLHGLRPIARGNKLFKSELLEQIGDMRLGGLRGGCTYNKIMLETEFYIEKATQAIDMSATTDYDDSIINL